MKNGRGQQQRVECSEVGSHGRGGQLLGETGRLQSLLTDEGGQGRSQYQKKVPSKRRRETVWIPIKLNRRSQILVGLSRWNRMNSRWFSFILPLIKGGCILDRG